MLATANKQKTKQQSEVEKKPEVKTYRIDQEVVYKGERVTIVGITNRGRNPQVTVQFLNGTKKTVILKE